MLGSQYGALADNRKNTGHLRFEVTEKSLSNWQKFFQTGILHQPSPKERPDEFLIDGTNVDAMERACRKKENSDNWYAFYHLGLGYFQKKEYEKAAEAFEKSDFLTPNAWAKHGLSCADLKLGRREESIRTILLGMKSCKEVSYLKEGFRILAEQKAFQELCDFYRTLGEKEQKIGKLQYFYALSLFRLGKCEEALSILDTDGGIKMEDIREGEPSVQELWEDAYRAVYGKSGIVPYQYCFRTSEEEEKT